MNDLNTIIDRDKDMSKLLHCTQWIFNMLKSVFGRALLRNVPKKKNLGRLIYRNGADILRGFHSLLLANHRSSNQIAQMEKENLKLTNKISSLITGDIQKNRNHESLNHAAKIVVSDKIKSDRLPDIDNFNCRDEIFKIHPFLWNFLFRISSTDKEEKLQISCFSWDSHYLDTPFNVSRMLQKLLTASCMFNLQNSQCVETLHLLLTDISDKFSDSSSSFLSINARIGGRILEGFIVAVLI